MSSFKSYFHNDLQWTNRHEDLIVGGLIAGAYENNSSCSSWDFIRHKSDHMTGYVFTAFTNTFKVQPL